MTLPKLVQEEWDNRIGPVVLTTVDKRGMPNTIYVKYASFYKKKSVLITDNYFDKTRKNLINGCLGTVLFLTSNNKSYQIKGRLEYHQEGECYDDMKNWTPDRHPRHAVAVLIPDKVYSGSKEIC